MRLPPCNHPPWGLRPRDTASRPASGHRIIPGSKLLGFDVFLSLRDTVPANDAEGSKHSCCRALDAAEAHGN